MSDSKHIVILGAGFAGTALARALERRLPGSYHITLISRDNYITYNPLLAEVVGSSILSSHVVAPVRQMLKRTRFCMVNVTDIDLKKQQIHYLGEGSGVIDYDQLIIACGVRANLDLLPGMAKYALPLKTVGDAMFLRNRVIARLEQAEVQQKAASRLWLTTFVIIGGGFSGVEVAGEIADFLHAAHRYYKHTKERDYRVLLLHGGERLLPELPARLGTFASRKMQARKIDIRLNTRVSRVDDQGVVLESGDRIDAGTVICTIGTAPHALVEQLPLPKERGRILTAPDMSVPDFPGLWALGDCAAVPNAYDDRLSPPTAQFATRQAAQLAKNIYLDSQDKNTQAFKFQPLGQLSSIGHNKAVAVVFGIHFSGFIGWLLWRGVYLLKFPTLARKVRLFFEWNWEMLFPQDVVHLSHTRTQRDTKKKSSVSKV